MHVCNISCISCISKLFATMDISTTQGIWERSNLATCRSTLTLVSASWHWVAFVAGLLCRWCVFSRVQDSWASTSMCAYVCVCVSVCACVCLQLPVYVHVFMCDCVCSCVCVCVTCVSCVSCVLCVCVHVCVCVCVSECVCACVSVCACVFVFACLFVCLFVCVFVWLHVRVCAFCDCILPAQPEQFHALAVACTG
jgi:hypothetical protein